MPAAPSRRESYRGRSAREPEAILADGIIWTPGEVFHYVRRAGKGPQGVPLTYIRLPAAGPAPEYYDFFAHYHPGSRQPGLHHEFLNANTSSDDALLSLVHRWGVLTKPHPPHRTHYGYPLQRMRAEVRLFQAVAQFRSSLANSRRDRDRVPGQRARDRNTAHAWGSRIADALLEMGINHDFEEWELLRAKYAPSGQFISVTDFADRLTDDPSWRSWALAEPWSPPWTDCFERAARVLARGSIPPEWHGVVLQGEDDVDSMEKQVSAHIAVMLQTHTYLTSTELPEGMATALVATSLIGALYLMYHLDATREWDLAECPECGRLFTPSRRQRRLSERGIATYCADERCRWRAAARAKYDRKRKGSPSSK